MRLPILLIAGLLSSSAAVAQECDRSDESQAGVNICAHEDYKTVDAKLNETYGEIMKRLSDDPDGRKLLQAAQRAWIAFRDAECDFSTAGSQSGSIYPTLMSGCLQSLTEARTEQLGGYLECDEGDMSCPVPTE
ncbi:lysozyme inhibitor LprI family protein [Mesorhizobium sp. WSM2239]|uniref:Lysozyme inhibitor LprI family protein n=2 Tax=unclassified Mesorhizobium TaxID=325217 RepID=A0AAU8DD32_9HYPH